MRMWRSIAYTREHTNVSITFHLLKQTADIIPAVLLCRPYRRLPEDDEIHFSSNDCVCLPYVSLSFGTAVLLSRSISWRHLTPTLVTPRAQRFAEHSFQSCGVVGLFQYQTRSRGSAISTDEEDGNAAGSYRFRHGVYALAADIDVEKGHIEVGSSGHVQSIIEFISRACEYTAQIAEPSLQAER